MDELNRDQAHTIWRQAETLKRLSDRLVGVGPFGVGLDGITAVIPVAGTIYSVAAGGWLLWAAWKVRASRSTMTRMALYLGADSLASGVPIVGQVADVLFQAHMMAANALQKDIAKRHGPPLESLRHAGSGAAPPGASSAQAA